MTPLSVLDSVDEVLASLDASVGHDEELFDMCRRHELPLDCLAKLAWFIDASR